MNRIDKRNFISMKHMVFLTAVTFCCISCNTSVKNAEINNDEGLVMDTSRALIIPEQTDTSKALIVPPDSLKYSKTKKDKTKIDLENKSKKEADTVKNLKK